MVKVNKDSIWNWVADVDQSVIDSLNAELDSLARAKTFASESIDREVAQLPLLIGADGVMVPFRRETRSPKGATRWCEVNVGIVARLGVRQKRGIAPKAGTGRAGPKAIIAYLSTIEKEHDEKRGGTGTVLWREKESP